MEHSVVQYDGNNYYYPPCFAKKRGKKDFVDKCVVGCMFLGGASVFTTKPCLDFLINSSVYGFTLCAMQELVSRICSIREEYTHLESRYKKSSLQILTKIFKINYATIFCLFIVAAFQSYLIAPRLILQFISEDVLPWIFSLIGIRMLTEVIQMDESPLKIAKYIDRIHGRDYGSGMAINYFYGYLQLVLPGLRERIGDFSSSHNVTFASTKLFIFLPYSGKCPQSAADYSPRGILSQSEVTDRIELNRGGVRRRDYHNTCYKLETNVNNNMRFLYICCEFASALQTFYEVRKYHHSVTELYIEYELEIVTNFYTTLQKLIEEKDFGNYCELIFFADRDDNGRLLYEDRLDIGDLLLRKLNII